MYPKNSANPPSVFLGPIYLLSDNSIVTSGASAVVTVAGAQSAAAADRLNYRGNGVWEYVPSQAEADNNTFHVLLYKAGCTSDGVLVAPAGCDANAKVALQADAVSAAAVKADAVSKLQVGLATASQLDSAVWAQTRFRMSIPEKVERPDVEPTTYLFGISSYDRNGALADCDASPTVHAYFADGSSADAKLGAMTKPPETTGVYWFAFEVAADDPDYAHVRFVGSAAQGGDAIGMVDYTQIVNDISPDFTTDDRAVLETIAADYQQRDVPITLPIGTDTGQINIVDGRVAATIEAIAQDCEYPAGLLSIGRQQVVALPDRCHALLVADGELFAVLRNAPCSVLRFADLANLSVYSTHTFDNDGLHQFPSEAVYDSVNAAIYIIFQRYDDVCITRCNLADFSFSDVVHDLTESSGPAPAIATDGQHVYVLTNNSPSRILKYRIGDWAKVAAATINDGATDHVAGHALLWDSVGGFLYGSGAGGWLAKIAVGDLSHTVVTFAEGDNLPTDDMAQDIDHVYVGLEGTDGVVLSIAKSDLTVRRIQTTANYPCNSAAFDGTYAWFVCATTPGVLVCLDPATHAVEYFTLPPGANVPNELVLLDGQMYLTTWEVPFSLIALPIPRTIAGYIRTALGLAAANLDERIGAIPTASQNATAAAGALLLTPANKLGTDAEGRVVTSNAVGPDSATIAESVWHAESRTLSGTNVGIPPTAALSDCDIFVTAFKNGTKALCARVFLNGVDVQQANVATIVYSVFLLDDDAPDVRAAIVGHNAVHLNVADVIFDSLQSDGQVSNYNFKHTVPIHDSPAFTIAGRAYLVEYIITPNTGEPVIVRFNVKVT